MKMNVSRLVFCHVPKTAGSSVTRLLRDKWPGPHALDIFEDEEGQTDLADTLRGCGMMAGHLSHANVLRAIDEAGLDAYKLTSLRSPIDHVLSNYHQLRAHQGADAAAGDRVMALREAAREMGALEWMGGRARHMPGFETLFDNPQIRMILNRKTGPITLADAQEAIAVMGRFDGVILFERLEESVRAVMQALGMEGPVQLPRLMTNPSKRHSVATLGRAELQAAMALTRYDAVLYDVVSAGWCARLAGMQGHGDGSGATWEPAPEILLADVVRTSMEQRIEHGAMGSTITIQGNDLFLHPPHGDLGALRIVGADFPGRGHGSFSTQLSLEHPAAPAVEISLSIREGERVAASFATRVTPAAKVPVRLRFPPLTGPCAIDLELRSADPAGINDYAWMMMWKPVIGG